MKKYFIALLIASKITLLITVAVFANNPVIYEPEAGDWDWGGEGDFEAEIEARIQTELEDRMQIASVTVLMDAAKHGTSADIKKLIKDGEYIHAKDYEGNTALTYAVENNTPEVVQALIDAGAYVSRIFLLDFVDDKGGFWEGYRSMKYAEVIGVLVKAGADVNARDDNGSTVLMKAVDYHSHASVSVVNALLEAGADVNAKNEDDKTALMYAVKSAAVVKVLLKSGADVNAIDNDGKTALMYAAAEGNDYAVNALLDAHADINAEDNGGKTALGYAKASGKFTNYTLKRLGANWYELHWF